MGRPKGSPNKASRLARDLAEEMGVDPLEILLLFASQNWKALGYDSSTCTRYSATGEAFETDRITPEIRMSAAREAAKYIYPTQKAVDHRINPEESGVRVVIEDYSSPK